MCPARPSRTRRGDSVLGQDPPPREGRHDTPDLPGGCRAGCDIARNDAGLIAAATASTFSGGLAAQGIGGASKTLPVTFLVIVATVALYGLTAVPVARRLGVARPATSRPLLAGGQAWWSTWPARCARPAWRC